jgi:hypothetical protein
MAPQKQQPLDERIKSFRAEIDAIIDARVAQVVKECKGNVPAAAIRQMIMKHSNCQCAVYLDLKAADDKAAARTKAEAEKGAAA